MVILFQVTNDHDEFRMLVFSSESTADLVLNLLLNDLEYVCIPLGLCLVICQVRGCN